MRTEGQFRYSYFTPDYEATLAFYRDGLGLPVVESWTAIPRIATRSSAPLPG